MKSETMKTSTAVAWLCLIIVEASSKRTFRSPPFVGSDHECMTQLELDPETVKEAFNGNYMLSEENLQVVRYLDCVWERTGYLTPTRSFNLAKIKAWATQVFVKNLGVPYQTKSDVENVANSVDFSLVFCNFRKRNGAVDNAIKMYNCLIQHLLIFANIGVIE